MQGDMRADTEEAFFIVCVGAHLMMLRVILGSVLEIMGC